MRPTAWAWIVAGLACTLPSGAKAQHATLGSPAQSLGSGLFNQTGVTWGLQGHGVSAQFGGTPAMPLFGQPNAAAGLQTGFQTSTAGWNFGMNAVLAQGASTSNSSVSPSVTTINGGTGQVIDTSITPFVVGVIPVVGDLGRPGINFGPGAVMPGSAVQLPTFSSFGVATSVNVPDGGGAFLGGMNSAAAGGNQFGPNRSGGSQTQAQQVQVRAQIHDMAELDAAVLAAAGKPAPVAPPDHNALALGAARTSSAGNGTMSVAEARRLHEVESQSHNDEAQKLYDRGQQAENDGKPGTAKVYYQMAARRASGELRSTIIGRLQALVAPRPTAAMAQGEPR